MRSPPPVPGLRHDLRPKKVAGKLVVDDPVRRVRVPIDELTLQLMECLADGPMSQDALATELGAPRVELQRRVRLLTQQLLLQTPRAAAVLAVQAAAASEPLDAATVPLGIHTGLRHTCVGCGACCHGSDVGPLDDRDVANIEAGDWLPHLASGLRRDELIETVPVPGGTVRMTGHKDGRCVFLTPEKLCAIHAVSGATAKPVLCQLFPFTFTRTTTGVDVSYSMECRAWWTAKQAAPPTSADEPQIRALLARGAPVLRVPNPVPVTSGYDWDPNHWESIRSAVLARIDAAPDHAALIRAVLEPVRDVVRSELERFAASEVFATRDAWAVPEPNEVDQTQRFFEACARLDVDLDDGLAAIGEDMTRRDRPDESDRVQRLRWATRGLLRGRSSGAPLRFEHEHEIWRDMARAALQAHEPARRGGLVQGTAVLVLRLLSGHLLSALLAQTALRGRTSEQDATDAMVLVTKLWRGTAFERLLASVQRDLVAVFFWNAEVLAFGAAPRALPAFVD